MKKTMRAKFRCNSVTDYGYQKQVELDAVMSDENQENQDFNKYTPAGKLTMTIDQSGAMDFIKPEKEYYLDFVEAE
jgi:hypothetical protein